MLEPLCDNIWHDCSHNLRMPGGMYFPCRMTVIKLSDGGILLHSPIPISDETAAQIDALGEVTHIVAPNNYHHLFLPAATARYPEATVWGAPGLPAKRPEVSFDHILGQSTPSFADELEPLFVAGVPELDEHVFFHHPTKSLIVTDLIFHIQEPHNFITRVILTMVGVHKKCTQSKVWRFFCKDREAAGLSARAITELPAERLIMAHGQVVEGAQTRDKITAALKWMTSGAPVKALPASS
ncbi:MAG: DUF4336 domain-containing protein [Myxococcota bacterium]|nr:DUF4336 domain-containing protein [Myxococcota bacterium]MEC9443346.1 DUF4336 domain-containing protein [Myxococcota bacterium]